MGICTITAYPEDWDLFSKILKVNLDRGFQVESIENHVVRLTHSHPDMEEEYFLHEPGSKERSLLTNKREEGEHEGY